MRKAIVSFAALCVALSSHGADGFYRYSSYNPEAAENAPNIGEFSKASDKDARLQTWWHWINGNVSKDGIKKDLDAMAEMGYGTAVIFGLEGSIRGPVKFASPEWYEMFAYAAQVAAENGMEIGAHNCDGWNEAGGPWNPVENSMKKLVWTIEYVDGDGSEKVLDLEKPHHILDFYRDIAVIAWPTKYGKELEMQKTLEDILPATPETIFPADHPVKDMFKGHSATLDHARFITENEKLVPYGFTMKFKKPFEAGGVYCYVNPHRMRPADVWLEASDDVLARYALSRPERGRMERTQFAADFRHLRIRAPRERRAVEAGQLHRASPREKRAGKELDGDIPRRRTPNSRGRHCEIQRRESF